MKYEEQRVAMIDALHKQAKRRRDALTRFALDFLKANLDELEGNDMLEAFQPLPTEEEIEELKQYLGIKFA